MAGLYFFSKEMASAYFARGLTFRTKRAKTNKPAQK